jgi:hypothetical protein
MAKNGGNGESNENGRRRISVISKNGMAKIMKNQAAKWRK